jgi:hypothetical protein
MEAKMFENLSERELQERNPVRPLLNLAHVVPVFRNAWTPVEISLEV